MLLILFQIIALILSAGQSQALSCNSCQGLLSDLTNATCSTQIQNDSCYMQIGYAIDTGNWLVSLDAFKETNRSDDFPYDYKKPKSGSDFIEIFYIFSDDRSTNQIMTIRYFCYTDKCNQLALVQKFIEANIKYMNFEFSQPITECLTCKGPSYDSVKSCTATKTCTSCFLQSNAVNNDLFSFVNWSSDCSSRSGEINGALLLQYEMKTGILNVYTSITCYYKECTSFDFLYKLTKSVELSF